MVDTQRDARYRFGELRLSDLNSIYYWRKWSLYHDVGSYLTESTISRYGTGLIFSFTFVSLTLLALQLAVGQSARSAPDALIAVSYRYAILMIVLLVALGICIFIVAWDSKLWDGGWGSRCHIGIAKVALERAMAFERP